MEKVAIKLPAQLDMTALSGLREELVAAMESAGTLQVDGSRVERVGTPAIQLLLATAKAFSAEGRRFVLKSPSEALSSALDDLGLALDTGQWSTA